MSKYPKFHHTDFSCLGEPLISTNGLTPEQRKAVEKAVLPPMPASLSEPGLYGARSIYVSGVPLGAVHMCVGTFGVEVTTTSARSIAARLIEFADAIEARK